MQSTENDDMTDVEWVAAFKTRWQEADEAGMAGGRVEYALRPLLAELAAERERSDRAEARIAELQQPRSLHLYADECVGGYFLREASDSDKRTLHRFVQEVQSPRVFPEATA